MAPRQPGGKASAVQAIALGTRRCELRSLPGGRRECLVVIMVYTDDLADLHVLVVEDEAITAIDVAAILQLAGGTVVGPAYSLSQGFDRLRHRRIDCALLDVNLHDELVFGLADALAERDVPIVFVSAHSLAIAPARHRHRRHVQKPFTTQSLIDAIRHAVFESRLPAAKHGTALESPSP